MSSPETPVHQAIFLFAHKTEQLVGGATLTKMVELGAQTWLNLIYFETRTPAAGYHKGDAQILLDVIAQNIEDSMIGPYITDMAYFQDTTQAGQLQDWMRVFWATVDETVEGWTDVLLAKIEPTVLNPIIHAAVAPYL